MNQPDQTIEVLAGGATNLGRVVRMGEFVLRPLRPQSPAIHRLLRHLESVGFTGAPRLVGVRDGHEMLTYIPGDVIVTPVPPWAFDGDVLDSVARLIRDFHDACTGFDVKEEDGWDQRTPARWAGSQLCHGDLVRSNVILQDRRAVALIDFDLVSPSSAVWEIACAVRHWIPLRGEGPEGPDGAPKATARRLRQFCLAYGLPAKLRLHLIDAALDAEALQLSLLGQWVEEGLDQYRKIWEAGAPDRINARINWMREHRVELEATLADD